MAVRVVTDSACDLPPAVCEELGIEVVPLTIRFGDREYVDRNLQAVATLGRIIQVGLMAGGTTSCNLGKLLPKRASITGTVLRGRPLEEKIAVSGGTQLSMNLTRLRETTPAMAREEARRRLPTGGAIVAEEIVGLCPTSAAAGCPAAEGRLLEARLAAAAARLGASLCSSRSGRERSEEMRALAVRLEAESASLTWLGFDDALAGGERAAALRPVLKAAGIHDEELDEMLRVAALGFRDALGEEPAQRFPERVAALDRRLAGG